jgi:type II secretory pathway component PulF
MPSFQYTAITASGERVAGVLAAGNEQAILAELETRRLVPVVVKPVKERHAGFGPGGGGGRISRRALAGSYAQLADLLRAGVPLMRGLRLLGGRRSSPVLAKTFAELADAVAEGTDLAEAMNARPATFPKVHVALVRAGEKGGFLENVLARLGQFMTAQADLRAKVLGSLIYPSVLVATGVLVMGAIFGIFIPKFRPIFSKIPLNGLTKGVLAASDLVSRYGLFLLVGLVAGVFVLWGYSRRPSVRRYLDELRTRAPVIGPLTRSMAVARFCRVLGTMLANSIPMIAAMQIARDAAGNILMEEAIDGATEAVRQGEALAPPLSASGLFSDDVVEMISVGESANNLDSVLITIADTVEQRLDRQLSAAVKLIEPVLLLILAAVIGIVAIALVMPMTQLSSTV